MVNLMADTGLLGLDTVGAVISDGDGERVVKVFVYEPKLTLTPEILLDSSPEAEKLRLLHRKYLFKVRHSNYKERR